MGEKIIVGTDKSVTKGLITNRPPFMIDNDSFPTLINAYQWRGRIKRKRGTALLVRLQRYATVSFVLLTNSGQTGIIPFAPIVPGSVNLLGSIDGTTYTDPSGNGILLATGGVGTGGSVNYSTGSITISAGGGETLTGSISYYPALPVMGLEELILVQNQYPGTIGFDTTYAYNITTGDPATSYDVSYYKNPPSAGSYVAKSTPTPLTWNGQNYQQFWSTNEQGAFWATNGITEPFNTTNIGMPFARANTITFDSQTATTLTITISSTPLIIGDFVFVNEWLGSTPANSQTLNFQSGYVTAAPAGVGAKTITITFPNANIAADTYAPGIVQYLTNRSDATKDCIRWYDGDPTNGSSTSPVLNGRLGWVNFCPPLSLSDFSISELIPDQYYLVGAKMIFPYKDRILFIGVVIQSSSSSPIYLEDTIVYSQNGTPYYTASFQGNPSLPTTFFNPILTPSNQTATANAYWGDQTGFGGFVRTGTAQQINTVSPNEDVLMVGLQNQQTKLVYTGNDILPFVFYFVNSELGSGSTFSAINLDEGVISVGSRGFTMANQNEALRIDSEIPDLVFEIDLINNGAERMCAIRDFINEWIYFTYPSNSFNTIFPNTTLQYNYREQTWSQNYECYTTYGSFRRSTGQTWATIGNTYPTWADWNDPWNAGQSNLLQKQIIAGTPQGFVMLRDVGTGEQPSIYIQSISGNTITSPNHCLNNNDFILITGALDTVGPIINGNIYQVFNVTQNTFLIANSNPANLPTNQAYGGSGLITRMYIPYIQTKQFPAAWGLARKTRLGPQQYLLTTTNNSQITLLIFLSMDAGNDYNRGPIVPDINSTNNSLIYSQVLYTCPESSNLGLTPANISLQMISDPTSGASPQQQIWHRMSTSLIGDTIQIGFTISSEQMTAVDDNGNAINAFAELELMGFILDVNPSMMLA